MKPISLCGLALTGSVLAAVLLVRGSAQCQEVKDRARPALPHKAAVVDVAYVLTHCKRLETELKQLEELARTKKVKFDELVQQAQAIAEEIKSNKLMEGTEEFSAREEAFIKVESRGKSYAELANKELNRKYAQAHVDAYRELKAVLERFAKQNGYTLILNARREPASSDNPREVALSMAQFVTWHDSQDDLTDAVLNYLNRQYEAAEETAAPAKPARPKSTSNPPARKSAETPSRKASK